MRVRVTRGGTNKLKHLEVFTANCYPKPPKATHKVHTEPIFKQKKHTGSIKGRNEGRREEVATPPLHQGSE